MVDGDAKGGADPISSANDPATPGTRDTRATPAETTVATALHDAEQRLEAAGIHGARFEATLLLGHILGHSRAQLIAALSDPLTDEQQARFGKLTERRANREPLQYLRGRAPFLDFEVEVGPGVFIPRPETEGLVERALELWDPAHGKWAVDVCTGSGAIAIALARAKLEGRVLAVDQSPTALNAVARNADNLGVRNRVALVRGNFLGALDPSPDDIGIIVCNPPYVAESDEVDPEIRYHEPRQAWAAGTTGLEAYERIIPEAAALLRENRSLVLELGYGHEGAVRNLLEMCGGWDQPTVEADHRGIARVLAVQRASGSTRSSPAVPVGPHRR